MADVALLLTKRLMIDVDANQHNAIRYSNSSHLYKKIVRFWGAKLSVKLLTHSFITPYIACIIVYVLVNKQTEHVC